MRLRIFISSVQKEFADERRMLAEYIRHDPLLGLFFSVFLFEESPAVDVSAAKLYLPEVESSDIPLYVFRSEVLAILGYKSRTSDTVLPDL